MGYIEYIQDSKHRLSIQYIEYVCKRVMCGVDKQLKCHITIY